MLMIMNHIMKNKEFVNWTRWLSLVSHKVFFSLSISVTY